ncbi:AraC-like DNA-binding protein [Microbacterium resistens]|uniref:AraC-like DNA-binding protein n=1 Tax=Microbacterium resistens TaxID=156977 RepID=A0ABU1SED5_9MICO|nr:helix-turn-helix domain-containing protein [Microbacterium resistens]MDR6867262.1 AraC-like DNA-binding protein [Microbacterium resistens]
MPASAITRLLANHLGLDAHGSGLLAARSFRSIDVTLHRTRESTVWAWGDGQAPLTHAAVILTGDGKGIPPAADSDRIGLFLPPGETLSIEWDRSTEVLAVWTPIEALVDFTEGTVPGRSDLPSSPLTTGLRAFAYSLARQPDEGSSMARYAVERLLAEMIFGALLEQESVESAQRSSSSLLERARSAMLMNREDPAFGPAQLAAELHISARQLQRAFARLETTPGDALRRMRVELAESLLRNAVYARLTVDELARYSGFSSALQLRRAMRAEGLPSPSAYRRNDPIGNDSIGNDPIGDDQIG